MCLATPQINLTVSGFTLKETLKIQNAVTKLKLDTRPSKHYGSSNWATKPGPQHLQQGTNIAEYRD